MAASSNNLRYWELSQGGRTGSIFMDASAATATATGLQCGLISVISTAVFSVLTGRNNFSLTAINFKVDLGLTGVTVPPCDIWPGYGRWFTNIQITSGLIQRYEKRDN